MSEYLLPADKQRLVQLLIEQLRKGDYTRQLAVMYDAMLKAEPDGFYQLYDIFEGMVRGWLDAKVEFQTGEAAPAPPPKPRSAPSLLGQGRSMTEVEECRLAVDELNRAIKRRADDNWNVMAMYTYPQASGMYALLVFNRWVPLATEGPPAG